MKHLARGTLRNKARAFLRWRKARGGAVAAPNYAVPGVRGEALLKTELAPVDEMFAYRSRHWQMPRLGRYEE